MDQQPPSPLGPGRWPDQVRDAIYQACETCVAAADVDGGGVALVTSRGVRDVVYASNDVSQALEDLQVDLAEGPCVDAATTRAPVLVGDVQDPRERSQERWPFFHTGVDALGVRGLFALPLRIGSVVLGTIELYRITAGLLETAQLSNAIRTTDELGRAILELGHPSDLGGIDRPGAFVHQAAGMVMMQLDGSIDEAMAHLRARAFVEGLSLVDLSAQVVRGRRRFSKEL